GVVRTLHCHTASSFQCEPAGDAPASSKRAERAMECVDAVSMAIPAFGFLVSRVATVSLCVVRTTNLVSARAHLVGRGVVGPKRVFQKSPSASLASLFQVDALSTGTN